MIRMSLMTALFTAAFLAAAPATALAQGPQTGVSVSFDRKGLSGVSLGWSSGRTVTRSAPASIIRPRYGRRTWRSTQPVTYGGRYEWRVQRVWIPATREKVWNEPVIRVHYDSCGNRYETVVREGHWSIAVTPGHYQERKVKVWVPGRSIVRRY